MYKHIDLLVADSGVTHEAFVEAWQAEYTPIVADTDSVVRYQQVLPTEPDHAEFDGLSELYFDSLADLQTVEVDSPADVLPVGDHRTFAGEETVQRDDVDGETDGLYKHSAFLVRKAGLSHEAFVDHWQTNHTPIAREIAGVVKYDTVRPADPGREEFDGVAELYFEDVADLYAALGSEGSRDYDPDREMAARAREDVDNFLAIDERPRLIGRTHLRK